MAMVNSLCENAMQFENGALRACGPTDKVILGYTASGENSPAAVNYRNDRRRIGKPNNTRDAAYSLIDNAAAGQKGKRNQKDGNYNCFESHLDESDNFRQLL